MKKTKIVANLSKTPAGFLVRYNWPSSVTGDILDFEENFQANTKAIKFIDSLKISAVFWNFSFDSYGIGGLPLHR